MLLFSIDLNEMVMNFGYWTNFTGFLFFQRTMDYQAKYLKSLQESSVASRIIADLHKKIADQNDQIVQLTKLLMAKDDSKKQSSTIPVKNAKIPVEQPKITKLTPASTPKPANPVAFKPSTPAKELPLKELPTKEPPARSSTRANIPTVLPTRTAEPAVPIFEQRKLLINPKSLSEYGTLTPYTLVFKKSHPGSLSNLRKGQRESIKNAILEYLEDNIGQLAHDCVCTTDKGKTEIAIPSTLVDRFLDWFNLKIDNGLLDYTKKSNHSAPTVPISYMDLCGMINLPMKLSTSEVASCISEFKKKIHQSDHEDIIPSGKEFEFKQHAQATLVAKMEQVIAPEQTDAASDTPMVVDTPPTTTTTAAEEVNPAQEQRTDKVPIPAMEKRPNDSAVDPSAKRMKPTETTLPEKPSKPNGKGEILRYNHVFREIYANYNHLPMGVRVDMKRRVKQWLKMRLGDQFDRCMMTIASKENPSHQTYGIPINLKSEFITWAKIEIEPYKQPVSQ
ncbi:hypothetical protein BC833DRAFT_571598 [Globomyces pollinis-pini]|nr:hypothetical protein BC833DRAFT_571598 [Globomyces pollinis-pini]